MKVSDLKVEYITNEEGERKQVVLSIEDFEELLEGIEDLATIADRRDDPVLQHEEVLAKLRRDGIL